MFQLLSYPIYFLAFFLFSFILWRRLREDYTNDQIYGWTLAVLIPGLLVVWLFEAFLPDFTFLGIFLVTCSLGYFFLKRLDFRFFEFIEGFTPAWLTFALISWIGVGVSSMSDISLDQEYLLGTLAPQVLISFLSLYLFSFFAKRYRRFSWYPSGKVGFAGLSSLGIFFLFYALLQSYDYFVNYRPLPFIQISYVSIQVVNGIIGGAVSILLFYMVYLRSGRRG